MEVARRTIWRISAGERDGRMEVARRTIWRISAGERDGRPVWRLAVTAAWRRRIPVNSWRILRQIGQISGGTKKEELLEFMLDSLVAGTGYSEHMTVTVSLGFTFGFFNIDHHILFGSFICNITFFINNRFHITDRTGSFGSWFNFACICFHLFLFS